MLELTEAAEKATMDKIEGTKSVLQNILDIESDEIEIVDPNVDILAELENSNYELPNVEEQVVEFVGEGESFEDAEATETINLEEAAQIETEPVEEVAQVTEEVQTTEMPAMEEPVTEESVTEEPVMEEALAQDKEINITIDTSAITSPDDNRPIFTDYESYIDGFDVRPEYDDYEMAIDKAYAQKKIHHKVIQIDEGWVASISIAEGILVEIES